VPVTKNYCTEDETELIENNGIYVCKKCSSKFIIVDNTIIVIVDDIEVILGRLDLIKIN